MKIENKTLDETQISAVTYLSDLLVIAGAGSGKTFTMLAKIKYLIEEVKTDKLLILTYTNEAVDEINKRLNNLKIKCVKATTFHKYAFSLMDVKDYTLISEEEIEERIDNYLNNPNDLKLINLFLSEYLYDYNTNFFETLDFFYCKETDYQKWKKRNLLIRKDFSYESEFYYYIKEKKPNYIIKLKNMLLDYFNYSYKEKIENEDKNKNEKRKNIFLSIYNEIILSNTNKEEITYDNIIEKATETLNNKSLDIDYILVDEYQDISYKRFLFLQRLKENTKAKLCLFGDDYQAIYHFSGGEVEYFLNIKKYYPEIKFFIINKTYRFSNELIDKTNKLMRNNKFQIIKKLKSDKTLKKPIIIIDYKNIDDEKNKIKQILENLNEKAKKTNTLKIFILSRYRHEKNIIDFLKENFLDDDIYLDYDNLKIHYKTVHQAKGLEADYILLINVNNSKNGFPSSKKNDSIFFTNERYIEEERRLFYVAVTRTKNKVFIFSEKNKKSIFINEIK